jgi:hypothetical protein
MNPPVQPGQSSDPGTPVDVQTPPAMQDRTLVPSTSSTFKFLKSADPNNAADAAIVDGANQYLQSGKKLEDLPVDHLDAIWQAVNGSAVPDQKVVLNNRELFYQLNFKNGKYEPQLLDQLGTPQGALQAAWDFVKSPFQAVGSIASGAAQAIGQDIQQVQQHGLASLPEFLISHNIATAAQSVAGTEAFYSGLPIGVSDAAQDLWIRANRMVTSDPAQKEKLDREQSEVIRTQALANQQGQDMVSGAKGAAANVIAGAGLPDLASQVQNAQIPAGISMVAQMAADPLSYVEFGVGKAPLFAGKVEQMGTRFQRLEEATGDLAKINAQAADQQVQRSTFETIRDAPNSSAAEVGDANKALAALAPAEAQTAQDLSAAQAEHTAATTAVGNDVTSGVNTVSNTRAVVANLASGTGAVAQGLGKILPYTSPAKLLEVGIDKLFPNAPDFIKNGAQLLGMHLMGGFEEALGGKVIREVGGSVLQNIGRTLSMVGPQLMLGRNSVPFFKAMAENTQGLTRTVMSVLDNQLVYAIPDTVRGAVKAAVIGGATGYLSSGGQADPTTSGAGIGGALGAVGSGMGQIGNFNSPTSLHIASIGDRSKFMPTLSPDSANLFTKLDPQSQLHIASLARAHPDMHINFFNDPANTAYNGNHQVVQGINGPVSLVNINVSGSNPVVPILQHEIGHHIASHGLEDTVANTMLGDPVTNTPGIFTQRNLDGTPMTQLDQNGVQQFVPNAQFEAYKGDYNSKLPPGTPSETDQGIAQEMFADLHAQAIANPQDVQKTMRGLVPSDGLIGPNVVKNWLAKTGVPMSSTTGTPIMTDAIAKTKGLNDIVSNFYKNRNLKLDSPESERGAARVPVSEARKGTPEFDRLASQFDSTSDLKRNPDGTLATDLAGRPQIVPQKTVDAQHHDMVTTLLKTLSGMPATTDPNTNVLHLETDRAGKQAYVGQDMTQPVMDALGKSNQFNANQLLNIQKLNEAMKRDDGTMFTTIYNTAGKGGKYATLPAKSRGIVPVSWNISPENKTFNVKSFDPEQLQENITKAMRRKAVASVWGSKIDTMTDDVRTFLGNLTNNRPGETDIGLQKKGIINQLFGVNADANPTVATLQLKNPSVIKDYRIDRMNRVQELPGTTTPFRYGTYEQVRGYMQPRGMGTPAAATIAAPAEEVLKESATTQADQPTQTVGKAAPDSPLLKQHPWLRDVPLDQVLTRFVGS